jgi:hypothetical protein
LPIVSSPMPSKAVRLPLEVLSWYDHAVRRENAERRRAGLRPISGADLLRVVASRFAGLPPSHDIELVAVRERQGLPADMTMPPTGRKTTKGRVKKEESLTMEDPPHGGGTMKGRAKKGAADIWTPPHGGRTTKARAKTAKTARS